ncbi:MAG: hypothetical protein JW862_05245 [Anaerolineales bacterium]|nr:hypothetical protein [Anaerolineales bacterium]
MSAELQPTPELATPTVKPGHYNPVMVHFQETWGAFLLGIISIILLIGWLKAEQRYRSLLADQIEAS